MSGKKSGFFIFIFSPTCCKMPRESVLSLPLCHRFNSCLRHIPPVPWSSSCLLSVQSGGGKKQSIVACRLISMENHTACIGGIRTDGKVGRHMDTETEYCMRLLQLGTTCFIFRVCVHFLHMSLFMLRLEADVGGTCT